ncbi:MAG: histone deacetylase [Candidatus Krumholzibacteria bacterium]|nr:histone deacetylase [Candidatus Krumholzibacteria bacterium]
MTGIYHHELFGRHLLGYPHPESPSRYFAVMERLRECDFASDLRFIEAEPIDPDLLAAVHERRYIDGILSLHVDDAVILDWGDTVATADSVQAALHAAGAATQACGAVLSGELANAFCPVRPHGHHAEQGRAMGFCIFNNIAVAAAWLLGPGGLDRVAIVDWDVHHGNGTERIFIEDPRVLYISLHQYPHYPGTGPHSMIGTGPGTGFNLNIPLGAGADDALYRGEFRHRVLPALGRYEPEFILISCGFDGHRDDPLAGAQLTTEIFGEMTQMVMDAAARYSNGRIVSLLEGGYDLEAIADCAELHVGVLAGKREAPKAP